MTHKGKIHERRPWYDDDYFDDLKSYGVKLETNTMANRMIDETPFTIIKDAKISSQGIIYSSR